MSIKNSELILNPDGSVYHLNLKPEHVAKDVIFVGDQDRVEKITKYFDSVECTIQKREFKTQTGNYKGKRITVMSTGIGPDNIDIVLNELDALVNIDLKTRKPKVDFTSLNIVRVGTSGALQKDIPIDTILLSTHGLDFSGMLHYYDMRSFCNSQFEDAFIAFTNWDSNKARPLLIENNKRLEHRFEDTSIYKGVTATAGGFYGPQGRILRLDLQDPDLNNNIDSFRQSNLRITNLEMETAVIYGLSKLLGHQALSLNAIIANRATGEFSEDPNTLVDKLIQYTLNKFVN